MKMYLNVSNFCLMTNGRIFRRYIVFSLVNLRVARTGDLDLIYQTIVEDATKGHYSENYYSVSDAKKGLLVNLNNMINNEIRKNITKDIFSRVIIIEKSEQPIGFCIISTADDPKDLEIWMFSIFKDFRNKGYGHKFLKKLLKSIRKTYPTTDIVARCFESSQIMMNILKDNKFIEENSGYEARFFRLKSS